MLDGIQIKSQVKLTVSLLLSIFHIGGLYFLFFFFSLLIKGLLSLYK